jgi:tetratricopeptide (TPR) repeat protein/transglutaminase-like putative cysteine protease
MEINRSGFLGVIAALVLLPTAQAAERWDAPFADDPKAIVEAARSIPAPDDQGMIVLLEQHQYTIDASRRTVSTTRKVFRLMKQDAVEDWSSVEQEYQPWHESRPEMRARVISADGAVHWLDPKTISDSPVNEYDSSIFSDRRVLRAPLPAIAAGAVVEYEIVVRETAPLFEAGVTRRVTLVDNVPIQRFRLSIEVGKNVLLRTGSQLIPESAIRRQTPGGLTRVEVELGPISARKTFEANLPSDTSRYPYFSFSTGRSWQEVAASYDRIVDQQIRSPDLKSLLEGIDLTGRPAAVAARLAAKLHEEIRYTGVEFREAEIVPRTPGETLKRKYGDCKDKAAMLVAMLRAAGLNAHVALLDSGFETDIDADLPGLGVFDHAIVYVSGDDPLWIDATAAETRVGDLPPGDQGRLALVASPTTAALVRTPETQASDNWRTHTIEIRMSDFGPGEFRETIEAGGSMETRMRQLYDGGDATKTKEALERYVKRDFLAKSLGQFTATKKDNFSDKFRLTVQALNARRATTDMNDAATVLFPYLVFQELPYPTTSGLEDEQEQEKTEPRKHDFVFPVPHQIEYRYRILPPAFFKPRDLPSSVDVKLGSANYTRTFRTNPDGTIDAVFRFDTGKRRLSPAELEALREGLRQYDKQVPEVITFVSEASQYIALGEVGKALQLVQENAAKHEGQGAAQVRLSRMLVTAGAVESAIAVANRVIRQEPSSSQAWQTLGWAHQHDGFGRRFQGNWNPAEAERCYREAIKLDPDDVTPRIDLAILLEHNARGQQYGKGARLDEAVTLYREIMKTSPGSGVQRNLAIALLYAGRYQEAKDEAKKVPSAELQAVISTVVTAVSGGADRAIIEAQSYADDRATALNLAAASETLTELRQYDNALELMKAAARLVNIREFQARVELIGKIKHYESALYPQSDPRYPVQQWVVELFSAEPDIARLKPLFAKREGWAGWNRHQAELDLAVTRGQLESLGFRQENLLDLIVSLLELKEQGEDGRGYRISGMTPFGGQLPVLYVIREDGQYRILGSSDRPENVGELALELVQRNEIKSAQWWLDRVVADLRPESPDGTGGPAARFLWSGLTEETRGPDAIRVAAASLIGRYSVSEKAIQILKDARAKSTNRVERGQLDLALCESLEKAQKWNELLIVAERLAAIHPFGDDGFRFIVKAETGLGQWKQLRTEADRRLKSAPGSLTALQAMATSTVHTGNREGAAEYLKQMAASPFGGQKDRLFEAWVSMLVGKADRDLLTRLNHATEFGGQISADYWYTLGMLQVFLDKPEEAQRSLAKALDSDDFAALDARPWALVGKIYERYGLNDAAAVAYRKARSSPQSNEMAKWAVALIVPENAKQVEEMRPAARLQ